MAETPATTTPATTNPPGGSVNFATAFRDLVTTHGATGVKIGTATHVAKQIVCAAKNALRQNKSTKRFAPVLESRVGQQVAIVAIPGAVYLTARIFPGQIPEASKIAAVAGYAVSGALSEVSQTFLRRATPFFSAVARMADDLPELREPKNGHAKSETPETVRAP